MATNKEEVLFLIKYLRAGMPSLKLKRKNVVVDNIKKIRIVGTDIECHWLSEYKGEKDVWVAKKVFMLKGGNEKSIEDQFAFPDSLTILFAKEVLGLIYKHKIVTGIFNKL